MMFGAPATAGEQEGFKVEGGNVTSLEHGRRLAKGDRLVIPDGGLITLYDVANRKTRVCVGKYDGPVELCLAQPSRARND